MFFSLYREVAAGNNSILVVVNLAWNDMTVDANVDGDLPTVASFYTGALEAVYTEGYDLNPI